MGTMQQYKKTIGFLPLLGTRNVINRSNDWFEINNLLPSIIKCMHPELWEQILLYGYQNDDNETTYNYDWKYLNNF